MTTIESDLRNRSKKRANFINPEPESHLGTIIAVAIVCVLFCIIIGILISVCLMRRRRESERIAEMAKKRRHNAKLKLKNLPTATSLFSPKVTVSPKGTITVAPTKVIAMKKETAKTKRFDDSMRSRVAMPKDIIPIIRAGGPTKSTMTGKSIRSGPSGRK